MNEAQLSAARNLTGTQLLGWIVLIVPPLFWAGNFVVGRAACDDVPPMMLAFARHFVALVFLLPFGWAAMRRDMKRYWRAALATYAGVAGWDGGLQFAGVHGPALDDSVQRTT